MLARIKKIVRQMLRFLDVLVNPTEIIKKSEAPVQLHDFVIAGGVFFDSPNAIIDSLKKPTVKSSLELGELYQLFYNSNPKTLELLRMLIDEVRPEIVVETGVANGTSTRTILSSFKDYNLLDSKLYSMDVDPRVATPDLMSSPQFNFVIIESSKSFITAMESIKTVDLFYHDSDHSYGNQMLEYSVAWELLNPGAGILMSDDVNWSGAFLDFSKKVNRIPLLLADGGKFSGIIRK